MVACQWITCYIAVYPPDNWLYSSLSQGNYYMVILSQKTGYIVVCPLNLARRRSRGGREGPDPPGIFKIYILENNISRFSALSGVILHVFFKNFPARFARLLSYLTKMKVHICSVTTVRQFCRLPRKFQDYALFIYFLHLSRTSKTIDTCFNTLQLQCSFQSTDTCTKSPQNSWFSSFL